MTTERDGASDRTTWAELGRSSLEYMLTRWLQMKGGSGEPRVLMIWAWTARPRRDERVDTADSTREASELTVRNGMVGGGGGGGYGQSRC